MYTYTCLLYRIVNLRHSLQVSGAISFTDNLHLVCTDNVHTGRESERMGGGVCVKQKSLCVRVCMCVCVYVCV